MRDEAAKPLPDSLRRQAATQQTMDRYRGRPFAWKAGHTCVHMVRFHLRSMGHKTPTLPRIGSALGARRALEANDWPDVTAMLDSILPRIAPLEMRLGDIAAAEGLDGIGALFVCIPPFKLLGWHEEAEGAVVIDFNRDALIGAWRA